MTTLSEVLYRLIPLTQGQWAIVDVADSGGMPGNAMCAAIAVKPSLTTRAK
jgi:hypothetical protein